MSEKNKKLCAGCDICCRYVAIEIDKPTCKKDYDQIIWQLLHKNVRIFVDWDMIGMWVHTPCGLIWKKHAGFNDRPMICREPRKTSVLNTAMARQKNII